MKVVILAGGLGTRLSEETDLKPKPMVEIGGKPIIWHIMKIYSHYGFNEFIVCCGYKGYLIKEYFANYYRHRSDLTIDLCNNSINYLKNKAEPWKVTLIDTGLDTMTGSRIKRVKEYVGNEPFMLTYGDGVSDVNIKNLISYPQPHEANYLKLDCSKAKAELEWYPKWNIQTTLGSIVAWNKAWLDGENIRIKTEQQIQAYFNDFPL